MKKTSVGEKYRYALLVSVMIAVAAAVFIRLPHRDDIASAQGIPAAPVVGIQASEGSGSGGCQKWLTNVAYSNNPADYAGSMSYDGSPYGNTDCARIYLSGQGPFSQDFQIGIRMQNPKLPGGWGPWGWTPWAADIARGISPAGWSPWVGAIQNVGSDPGHAMYQVAVQTRPLPDVNDTISGIQIGLQVGDNNGNSNPPYYCAQPPGAQDDQVFTTGGVSSGGKPIAAPAGWSGANDLADCSRVYLSGAVLKGASEVSTNIPSNFTPSQTQSTGSDGQQLSITVKNNSSYSWPLDQATVLSSSGSCSVPYLVTGGNNCPALTAPAGTTCTSQVSNSSAVYVLSHTGGSFAVNGDPAVLKQVTTNTCTVSGGTCSNSSPGCSASASVCTDTGSCSQGGCNQSTCMVPQQFGGCGGTWNPGCGGVWGPGYVYTVGGGGGGVPPGGTAQFFMNSMTAPAAPSTYAETWQMKDPGGFFGAPYTDNITVSGALAPGSISVNSVNSQFPSVGVPATWSFMVFPAGNDPCTGHGGSCTNVSNAVYAGLNTSNAGYGLCSSVSQACHAGATYSTGAQQYTLRSIQKNSIAAQPRSLIDKVISFGKNLFVSIAQALKITPAPTLFLTGGIPSASFTMSWDPVANISLNAPAISITASGAGVATGPVTIINSGSPGSILTWSSTSNKPWLTATPATGVITNGISGNASQNITINANPTGLAVGSYTGTITFTGNSAPGLIASPLSTTLTVTFNVGTGGAVCGNGVLESGEQCDNGAANGVCPGATCTNTCKLQGCPPLPACSQFDASPSTIVIPGTSNLRYHCTNVTACSLSGGAFGASSSTPILGTTASGTAPVSPGVNTLYTLNCQGLVANASYTTSLNVQVSVGAPGRCERAPGSSGCPKP